MLSPTHLQTTMLPINDSIRYWVLLASKVTIPNRTSPELLATAG